MDRLACRNVEAWVLPWFKFRGVQFEVVCGYVSKMCFARVCCGSCVFACVCVYHLNRCKTSDVCRGHWGTLQSAANEDAALLL